MKRDLSLFLKEGGGSSLDQLVIIYVVIIGLRREGAKPNLQVVTKYAVFFFEGAPNRQLVFKTPRFYSLERKAHDLSMVYVS